MHEGNIVAFGDRFKKITKKGPGNSVLSFVCLQKDVDNVDYRELPENTSLQRAIKAYYLAGNRVCDSYGYILK